MVGSVWRVEVEAGQRVEPGQNAVVARGDEDWRCRSRSPRHGTVLEVLVCTGRDRRTGHPSRRDWSRRLMTVDAVNRGQTTRSPPPPASSDAFRRIDEVDRPEVWITLRPAEDVLAEAGARRGPRRRRARPAPGRDRSSAVKDNIDVAGLPTTAGCPAFAYRARRRPRARSRRLVEPGAVVLGKTNLDQFATGLVGTRSPYGAVRCAWRPERVSGGSSSGSAVAVALGIADIATRHRHRRVRAGPGRVQRPRRHQADARPRPRPTASCPPASTSTASPSSPRPRHGADRRRAIMAGPASRGPAQPRLALRRPAGGARRSRGSRFPRTRISSLLTPEYRAAFDATVRVVGGPAAPSRRSTSRRSSTPPACSTTARVVAERYAAVGEVPRHRTRRAPIPTVAAIVEPPRGTDRPPSSPPTSPPHPRQGEDARPAGRFRRPPAAHHHRAPDHRCRAGRSDRHQPPARHLHELLQPARHGGRRGPGRRRRRRRTVRRHVRGAGVRRPGRHRPRRPARRRARARPRRGRCRTGRVRSPPARAAPAISSSRTSAHDSSTPSPPPTRTGSPRSPRHRRNPASSAAVPAWDPRSSANCSGCHPQAWAASSPLCPPRWR